MQKIEAYRNKLMEKLKLNGCSICGYNKCNRALEWHHVEPKLKKFNINLSNLTRNPDSLITEIHKCILLCPNCHRELEDL